MLQYKNISPLIYVDKNKYKIKKVKYLNKKLPLITKPSYILFHKKNGFLYADKECNPYLQIKFILASCSNRY